MWKSLSIPFLVKLFLISGKILSVLLKFEQTGCELDGALQITSIISLASSWF